jgi:hypothetical protein
MKTKLLYLLSGLVLSGLMLSGCYTQLARPDREDQPRISRESESEAEAAEEAYGEETPDTRHQTNVYVYGGGWYGPYSYPWGYRYPRSRFYVSVGFGYYDTWDWCGTAWDWWYDPWCWDRHYAGFWRPYYYGWSPVYYDPFFYYPRYVYRGRGNENKKRDFTRRGTTPRTDSSPGTYGASGRGSLARPAAGTYARGDDGNYRRVRRDEVSTISRRKSPATDSDRARIKGDDSRRKTKRAIGGNKDFTRPAVDRRNSSGDSQPSVRRANKPAPSHDSGSVSRRSGSSGASGSGGNVSKPSGSGSAPKSSGNSSNKSGSSSNRRSKN